MLVVTVSVLKKACPDSDFPIISHLWHIVVYGPIYSAAEWYTCCYVSGPGLTAVRRRRRERRLPGGPGRRRAGTPAQRDPRGTTLDGCMGRRPGRASAGARKTVAPRRARQRPAATAAGRPGPAGTTGREPGEASQRRGSLLPPAGPAHGAHSGGERGGRGDKRRASVRRGPGGLGWGGANPGRRRGGSAAQ